MLAVTFSSSVLYEVYAFQLDLRPVIIMNGLFSLTVLLELILAVTFRRRPQGG